MITFWINCFWGIVKAIETSLGLSLNPINSAISGSTAAVNTVNGYLKYVYFFIPKTLFTGIIALFAALLLIRIVMALVNFIKW